MSSLTILDVQKICRVCLSRELNMKFIFEPQQSPNIAQMLSELTIYKMQNFNQLPHLICSDCLNLVNIAYKLKEKCENSHRTLIELLDNKQKHLSSNVTWNGYTIEKGTQTVMVESLMYNCEHIDNSQLSHEDGDSNKSKISSEASGSAKEIFNLLDVERFEQLTDDEKEIPLKFLLETTDTTQIVEDVLNKSLVENEEFSIESQNSIKFDTKKISKDNSQTTKRKRGRPPKKTKKILATSKQTLFDNDTNHDFSENSSECIQPIKQCRGRPSKKSQNCTKYCENNVILQQQVAENHPPKRDQHFSCKICNENFTDGNDLKYHLHNCHKESKELTDLVKSQIKTKNMHKLFYCSKCEKNFSTKNSLQRHLENHSRKRYVCKECLQVFSTKEDLNSHAKVEGHDKPLLCPECGLRCKSSNILTVHLRRHNGEKPFKCKFCGKGFPRTDDLKMHEKYHTGEKSHFCETCGKGFFRKYNLRIHLRVHTGEKPHKCPHCPQAFAQSNDLKAHIRRHTGERFRCEICNAAFLQGYQIRQHKLQEHGINETPPTQRVKKFTSPEEQAKQIKQNLQEAPG